MKRLRVVPADNINGAHQNEPNPHFFAEQWLQGYLTYHHLTEENFSLDALLEDLEVPVCNPHLSHHHRCRNDLLAPVSEK